MVRLKGSVVVVVIVRNFISIPYGAIKSKHNALHLYKDVKFQFLMVRLKDIMKTTVK